MSTASFKSEAREVRARRFDTSNAETLERAPVLERDADVHERRLDQLMQRCLLRFGQLRAEIRNHHVPAGEHALARRRPVQRAAARIDHFDAVAAGIANAQHRAVEANRAARLGSIELRVVGDRGHDVARIAARHRCPESASAPAVARSMRCRPDSETCRSRRSRQIPPA